MLKKTEFSKTLLIQESALIWVLTIGTLVLAYLCIKQQFMGPLPWLATMVTCAWGAYGVSQVYYYKKSLAENTQGGIKFQTVMTELEQTVSDYNNDDTSYESYDDMGSYTIPEDEYQI